MTDFTLTPNSGHAFVAVIQPNNNGIDGAYGNCSPPGCQFNSRVLTATGTYTVRFEPSAQTTANFTLTLSQGVTGSLTPGSPFDLDLTTRGQHALLTFSASAGQSFALNVSSISTQPAGRAVSVLVRRPNGSNTGASSETDLTVNLRNLEAGTYSVMIVRADAMTASMQVLLALSPSGILADGVTQSYATTIPGEAAYFTFDAAAGDNRGLALTNLQLSSGSRARLSVLRPNGNPLTTMDCDVPASSPRSMTRLGTPWLSPMMASS